MKRIARVTVCDKCERVVVNNELYYRIGNKDLCLKCMLKNLDSQKHRESEVQE